jgi:translocation and assembly module TamA
MIIKVKRGMRMRSSFKIFFLFAAGVVSSAPLHAEIMQFRAVVEAPEHIKSALSGQLEIFRWKKEAEMDEAFFSSLYLRTPGQIKTILREYGYFSPEIQSELVVSDGIRTARFTVSPGKAAVVESVEFSFSGDVLPAPHGCGPAAHEIESEWLLPAGEIFTAERWSTAKRRLLRMFLVNCYPAARVTDSRAVVNPETSEAHLYLEIDSGPAFTLGKLEISGLERYPEALIHNLNFIKEGSPHSREKLLTLQSRLRETGYFEYADVRIEADPERHLNTPVKVSVKENKRKEIRMGLELSSDTGAGASFEYRDLNLRRRGLKLRNILQANRSEQLFFSGLQMPTRPNGTYDNYNFTASSRDIRNEQLNLLRFGFARTRPMGTFLRVFRLQYSRETRRLPEEDRQSTRALAPAVSWSASETNHLLYPSEGYLLNIKTAGALDGVFSDAGFFHTNIRGKIFHSAGEKNLFIARGEAGHVFAGQRTGIPSEFLFRTGGADTIRGYGYRSIGASEAGATVGGRYLFTGSLEYNRSMGDRWAAAVFIDGGSAYDEWDAFEPVFGYGAGIRLKTAAGPVNFDIAYGEDTKEYRLHFTMGVVF